MYKDMIVMNTVVYTPKKCVTLKGQETPVVDSQDVKLKLIKTVIEGSQSRLG